ncbi:hypothetical protein N8I74_10410 [Chitiniphilus purpureus]|uniref:LysM domain-containing protein n=1 Tax=Chitiniphilus purpureus TaxID=2981137 RepID=A0ABY6DJ72_9NEIS|nr:FimV/HubP family polar landmark protein [Chitiniphilus sp. CD1]UXY13733.1 hypothetical protein N8I74_10410 [Chitiniphilus sp. CD1]
MLSKPKIKACVLAVMLATPLYASAAGLGRLSVQSGLGQPFRGEIDLVSVAPEEADSLVVSLASPAAFANAQISYPAPSMGLRLNIEKRAGGQYYVAVSSSQPISEPFLDLLIELNWANGHIQREYTALIDPVDYSAAKVNPPAAASGRLSGRTPAPPAATARSSAAAEGAGATGGKTTRQAASSTAGAEASASEYQVKPGDTLSSIASAVKPEGVSLEQVLVALYRNNQSAFDGNMNRLKRGKILRVPGREEIGSVPQGEAAKEIRLQSENWRNYRQRVAEAAMNAPVAEQGQSSSGKISAQVEDKGTTQAENKDRLRLSKGADNKGAGGDAQSRIRGLEEEAVARQKALEEANQRVSELEKTVRDMEKMLAIKGKAGAAAPTPTPTVTPEAQPTPAAASMAVTASAASAASAVAAAPVASAPASAPQPKPRAPVQIEAPVEEEASFLDNLLGNPLLLGAGVGVLLLGAAGLMSARRRRPAVFEDSIITGGDLKPNTVLGNTGGAVISTQPTENSFLTDFSRQGLGTIDTDEVDPIAEAEVYMAYGRDTQAEEILKDALSKDPSRSEIRMKLLEIYAARKDRTSFEEIAAELFARTNGSGPVWEQASYMGRNLDPENPLYARKDGSRPAPEAGLVDTAPPVAAAAVAAPAAAAAAPLDLDLSMDDEAVGSPAAAAPQPAPAPSADLDFDLDAFMVPGEEPAELQARQTQHVAEAPQQDELDDLDFNLDLDQPTLAEAPPAPTPARQLDEDLAQFAPAQPDANSAAEDALDLDFDFNLDASAAPASPSAAPSPIDIGLEQDTINELDLSAEDPVQTKIDLARAYIDMGDVEGAREILQEALSEGSAVQQQEARSLLDSL